MTCARLRRQAEGTGRRAGATRLRSLAERYLGRRPCPTKTGPLGQPPGGCRSGRHRMPAGLPGVVFAQQAFCEFHSFDYPGLEAGAGLPGHTSVRLDLETPFAPTGQIRTRLQAFAEILSDGGDGRGRKRLKLPCEETMKEVMTAYYTEAFTSSNAPKPG